MQQPPSNLILSWSDIESQCRQLVQILLHQGPFKGIVAVARGGMVPAALLAQILDIRQIDTLCIASYEAEGPCRQSRLKLLKGVAVESRGKGYLVVDDLVDSGQTARLIRELLPEAHLAVLYAKPEGMPYTDSYVSPVDQHTWITFPWERPEGVPV